MFNLPFFTNNSRNKLNTKDNIVALDIGTEQLKGVLFNIDKLGVNIETVSRIEQQQHAMRSGIITNLDTVLTNCRLTMTSLTDRLDEEEYPRHIVMGIAGEYIQGVSISVNYQRDENYEKEVTEREEAKIIGQIETKIEAHGKEDLGQRIGLVNEDIEFLHLTKTGVEIGGMPVDSLVGYKGKDVKLHYYASFAPKTYVESLRKVASELELNVIGIVSQPFAVARAFTGSSNRDFSAIFMDVGGGTTDIAIVEKGNVVETKMFAFGGRTFTKELAKILNLEYRVAEQRKIKYSKKELNKDLSREVQKIVYPVGRLWMKTVKTALESCQGISSFPPQIYLCGGGSLLPEIKEVMLEFPWKKVLPFAVVPKIEFFTPEKLENITDTSKDLRNVFDITPASLAKFVYDIKKEDVTNGR
jgi:cell division protein FtsA